MKITGGLNSVSILFLVLKTNFSHSLRSFVKYCIFHRSKIKLLPLRRRVISSLYRIKSATTPSCLSNPVAFPVLYFYWSLYPLAAIVLSGGYNVSILLPIVSFSNHRPRLERCDPKRNLDVGHYWGTISKHLFVALSL